MKPQNEKQIPTFSKTPDDSNTYTNLLWAGYSLETAQLDSNLVHCGILIRNII
jgi:hypothetical protein